MQRGWHKKLIYHDVIHGKHWEATGSPGKRRGQLAICIDGFGVCSIFPLTVSQSGQETQ